MNAKRQHDGLYTAFDYFNSVLFGDKLPGCLINFSKKPGSFSYFTPRVIQQDGETGLISEIGLGLGLFDRPTTEIMAELCRQMVRFWQDECGQDKPRSSNYCNKEWSSKMKEIGLIPLDSGIGYNSEIKYCIDPEGKFMRAVKDIPSHIIKQWKAISPEEFEGKKNKGGERIKYVCPGCGDSVRGKSNMRISCDDCGVRMNPEVKIK